MTILGDKNTFAIEYTFIDDPDSGKAALPEDAASWGEIAVWLDGKNLCQFVHQGQLYNATSWYLLPLLEWFAQNWGPLLYEESPPRASDKLVGRTIFFEYAQKYFGFMAEKDEAAWFAWGQRHALRSCADGGIYPDIFIRSFGENVEFSWGNAALPGMPANLYFTVPFSSALVLRTKLIPVLKQFLTQAAQKLAQKVPTSPRITALVRNIDSLDSRDFLSWLIPCVHTDKLPLQHLIKKIRKAFPSINLTQPDLIPAAVLMFGSCSPNFHESDVDTILDSVIIAPASRDIILRKYEKKYALIADEKPWKSGYAAAEDFLDTYANTFVEESVDIQALLNALAVDVIDKSFSDHDIRGVALAGKGISPSIFVNTANENNTNPQGRRYTLAHELCHLLIDRQYGREVGIISGTWAPARVEKRANAFAAMLLMPTELLEKILPVAITKESLSAMAQQLQVSTAALLPHLYNLGIIDKEQANNLSTDITCQRF